MLIEKKILESERNAVYVKSTEGSLLTGTVEQNKNVFDKYPELIREKFNGLLDALIALGLDTIVDDLANRYTITQTDTLVETETKSLVADVSINLTTGAITITKKDGTSTTIDTALEKVPATFEFVEDTVNDKFYLKVTNVDGTSTQTEVTNLMNQFEFTSGSTIQFTANKNGTKTTVSAEVKDGSITLGKLANEVTAYISESVASVSVDRAIVETARTEVLNASQTVTSNVQIVLTYSENARVSAVNANESATSANDSARLAQQYAQEAKNYRDETAEAVGGDYVTRTEFNNTLQGFATVAYVDDLMKVDESVEV
jgi:hypothetical protein